MGWQRWGREEGTEENTFGEVAAEKVQHCRITRMPDSVQQMGSSARALFLSVF